MRFKEADEKTLKYKENYRDAIDKVILQRENDLKGARDEYIADVFERNEEYRAEFIKMLGWPLAGGSRDILSPKSEKIGEEDGVEIYRMSFEILPGFPMTGLLFKKADERIRPMVIAQHGGEGTPEHVAGFRESGTQNYNDMIDRILKYDVNVFAPQLLLWNTSVYGAEYDRGAADAKLKRVGGSITALEIYGICRIIDYFETQPYIKNFGMIGLSYGGFYTLYTAAVEPRIKSAVSCSFFNDRSLYAWSDWTFFGAAKSFSDAEIACLVYPRRLCIEVGDNDELFSGVSAVSEFERLKKLSANVSCDWLDFIVFGGTHEFCKDDMPIKRLTDDLKK